MFSELPGIHENLELNQREFPVIIVVKLLENRLNLFWLQPCTALSELL